MRVSFSTEDLTLMSEALYEYDVRDGGWEHESKGLEFNVSHVLKELIRAHRKNHFDPKIVRSQLAPDYLQYALRLLRWSGQRPSEGFPSADTEVATQASNYAQHTKVGSTRLGAVGLAELNLAQLAHDFDHETERENAELIAPRVMAHSSRALVLAASLSALEFDFELVDTFGNRIDELRDRFGIQPALPGINNP